MKRGYVVLGFPCTLKECDPGPFVTIENPELLCFKTEYRSVNGKVKAFNSTGEYFCTGDDVMVLPVEVEVRGERYE